MDLMRSKHGMAPGLAVIMVGERRDSAKYVSMKQVSIASRYSIAISYPWCLVYMICAMCPNCRSAMCVVQLAFPVFLGEQERLPRSETHTALFLCASSI